MSRRRSRRAPLRTSVLAAVAAAGALCASAGGLIAAGSAQAATLPTLSLAITPTSITVGGTPQSGGVNVVSTATGAKEASVLLVLLKPGVSPAELFAYLESKHKKDINESSRFGSIVFATEAEAGHPNEVQTNLQPGTYAVLASLGEGPPKLHTSFTVALAKAPASLPTPQAVMRAIDFGFAGPTILHEGELVGVENEGWVVHMDLALRVKDLKSAKQLVKLLLAGKGRQGMKLVTGGITLSGSVSHGAYQQLTINAKPGVYVQVCFMNAQDGREHTLLGMERIIKIVK
jgi:hypothetical protein